ncbi:unnamed protein product, partial [Pylaiella littoralis]
TDGREERNDSRFLKAVNLQLDAPTLYEIRCWLCFQASPRPGSVLWCELSLLKTLTRSAAGMSALFDDAERFDSLIVVGDTTRHVQDTTETHVGPGTYSPSMANSKDFGYIGVSTSRRSKMDPPMSPKSTEHQRYSTGSVVRDGIWFHTSPSAALNSGPGPGEYSPSVITNDYERGQTAKPSSGTVGRQARIIYAWDVRGSAGGAPLSSFRNGFSLSSSMGTSARMAEFAQVSLHDGVLLLRGPNDGHRSNGIGPGEYHGVSNRQDPMTKRSYNMRAQTSQVHRERSLSFSGTSSTARAFLSLAAAAATAASTRGGSSCKDDSNGRPDLHLIGRHAYPTGSGDTIGVGRKRCTSPRVGQRPLSPASMMLSSMRMRAAAAAAGKGDKPFGLRSGGANSRSLSPKNNRGRPGSPIRGARGGLHGSGYGPSNGVPTSVGGHFTSQQQQQHYRHHTRASDGGGSRECRSLSPRGRSGGVGGTAPSPRSAAHGSPPRRKNACARSAPSSPRGGAGSGSGDAPYTFDYFGLAGQKGAWRGLQDVTTARAEMGIETPKAQNNARNQRVVGKQEGAGVAGGAGVGGGGGKGGGGGGTAGAPGSLLPEGVPAKGVCSPGKETRDDLHTYFDAANRTAAAIGSLATTAGSNLSPPPSPRALRPGSA